MERYATETETEWKIASWHGGHIRSDRSSCGNVRQVVEAWRLHVVYCKCHAMCVLPDLPSETPPPDLVEGITIQLVNRVGLLGSVRSVEETCCSVRSRKSREVTAGRRRDIEAS